VAIGPKEAQRRALRERKFSQPAQIEKRSKSQTHEMVETAKAAITNITNAATNTPAKINAVSRSLKWRSENPERYKATQRDLMRKKRASEKHPS
jgi:hypothetical protein